MEHFAGLLGGVFSLQWWAGWTVRVYASQCAAGWEVSAHGGPDGGFSFEDFALSGSEWKGKLLEETQGRSYQQ